MSYHKFTYKNIKEKLGIQPDLVKGIFQDLPLVSPSEALTTNLNVSDNVFLGSEMARRENYIAPILKEAISQSPCVLYSQIEFDVDATLHLTGDVDYIITAPPMLLVPDRPIIGVAEAKITNLRSGYGQCIAEMYASHLHNDRNYNIQLPYIYGAVTDGLTWQFVELKDGIHASIDTDVYFITDLPKILGILVWMIDTQLLLINKLLDEKK